MQLNLISSSDAILLCLNKGQTIKFSECNPSIHDRTCASDSECRYCVSKSSSGAYCPTRINKCNEENPSCAYLTENNQNTNPSKNPNETNKKIITVEENATAEQNNTGTTIIESNEYTKNKKVNSIDSISTTSGNNVATNLSNSIYLSNSKTSIKKISPVFVLTLISILILEILAVFPLLVKFHKKI